MKIYKVRHKATGLFYKPGGTNNLGTILFFKPLFILFIILHNLFPA